ncbi:MAG: CRISPR-associated protein Cas4 [Thermoproteota archaeon]
MDTGGGVLAELYRFKQKEFSERLRELADPRTVYVTDLVSCSHKRVMRLAYPLLSFQFEPYMLLGDLVHRGIQSLMVEMGRWRAEVSVEKEVDVGGEKYKLKGRIDLVRFAPSGDQAEEVVEVKTVRDLTRHEYPLEHHILQLRIYMNLLSVKRGLLLYVSPSRIAEYEVEPADVDVEELVRQTVYDEVRPRYQWECRYCVYRKLCPYARTQE